MKEHGKGNAARVPKRFGIRVEDESYSPFFHSGDVVLIDSRRFPHEGEICFVCLGSKELPCFRVFGGCDDEATTFARLGDPGRLEVIGKLSQQQPRVFGRVVGVAK